MLHLAANGFLIKYETGVFNVWIELLVVGCIIYALFGDYFKANAELIAQQALEKEIENNRKEAEAE